MISIEGRFEVRLISAEAFANYMTFRGFTVRSLAERANGNRSTIGHLRSGARTTCDPELAKRIEKALDAPAGSLFVPQVSRVAREVASPDGGPSGPPAGGSARGRAVA